MTWRKRTNYFNIPKVKSKGKQYDSKFEASFALKYDQMLKKGEIKGYDPHYRIPLIVNGFKVCDYYIDFAIYHNDGTVEYVECKGYPTDVWKLKWKLFCALYENDPNVTITLEMQGRQKPPKLTRYRFH